MPPDFVSLFVPGVFGHEVEVFAANDEGSVHFGRDNSAREDTPTDGDFTGEGTFLICSPCVRYVLLLLKSSRQHSTASRTDV